MRKTSPPLGFDPPTVQLVMIIYTDCAIPAPPPKKGVADENLAVISDYLDAASKDSISKLGKLDDRLHILEETSCSGKNLPSADIQNNGTEVSAPTGLSSSSVRTDGSRHSVGEYDSERECNHLDI